MAEEEGEKLWDEFVERKWSKKRHRGNLNKKNKSKKQKDEEKGNERPRGGVETEVSCLRRRTLAEVDRDGGEKKKILSCVCCLCVKWSIRGWGVEGGGWWWAVCCLWVWVCVSGGGTITSSCFRGFNHKKRQQKPSSEVNTIFGHFPSLLKLIIIYSNTAALSNSLF